MTDIEGGGAATARVAAPLPTDPGIYAEANSPINGVNLWELSDSGKWASLAGAKYHDRAAEFAPFVRLAPVVEAPGEVGAHGNSRRI